MKRQGSTLIGSAIMLVVSTLACSVFSRAQGDEAQPVPVEQPESKQVIRQWASSAQAGSEYDNPGWGAMQATGAPDTLDCGDQSTAWASLDPLSVEWLEVGFDAAVNPTEVNIYESHTPTQVVRVEFIDTDGTYHEVYSSQPEMASACPYKLSIPVRGADYETTRIKITVDQSQLDLPWDEIDAVELVGYGTASTALQPASPTQTSSQPEPTRTSGSGGSGVGPVSGNWATYSTNAGLMNDAVSAVAIGKTGILWVANGPFGQQSISRMAGGNFTNYEMGASANHHSLSIAPDGTVWAATGVNLAYFDGKDWTYYTKQDGLAGNQTRAVFVAPDGTVWAGSVEGVSRFDGKTWTVYTEKDGLIDSSVAGIALAPDGTLWFLTNDGLSSFDGRKWKSFSKQDFGDFSPNYPIRAIAVDTNGVVWVGSGGDGVIRFDGREWTTYRETDEYSLEYAKAIAVALDGSVWFGTEGKGVYRFDGQSWQNFKKSDGLCDDYVDSLAVALDGNMWFGCRKNGVARFGR